jgi:uncharacterized protein YbjT (DUF2867 family)
MKPRILVTTGNGRTGRAAIETLLASGVPVRALVTRDDGRARTLREAGAEVVVGSFYDRRDLKAALEGVQRAYHCPPFDPKLLHGATMFGLAAEEAGLEVVALMSGWNPHSTHPSVIQREHWMANNVFRRFSFDVIHVNPGLFAFPYLLGLKAIVHLGLLSLPFGQGLNAPPSNEDVGRLAAHALLSPERFVGRCLRPTGPELVSPEEVASILTEVVGRRVRYQDVSTDAFAKAASALGFPRFQIAQVRHYADELRAGAFADVTDHYEEVCGQAPESFKAIARRYVNEPRRIMPQLEVGSLFSALSFVLRMMLARVPDFDAWEQTRDYPLIRNAQLAHESEEWVAASQQRELVLTPLP